MVFSVIFGILDILFCVLFDLSENFNFVIFWDISAKINICTAMASNVIDIKGIGPLNLGMRPFGQFKSIDSDSEIDEFRAILNGFGIPNELVVVGRTLIK